MTRRRSGGCPQPQKECGFHRLRAAREQPSPRLRHAKGHAPSATELRRAGHSAPNTFGGSITERLFSLHRAGQSILFRCDWWRARVLDLPRLDRVKLDILGKFRRNVRLRIDGVHGAYLYTGHAINAIFRVDHHLVVHFVKAGYGAHLYAVGELASVTFVGHDVGHGIRLVKDLREKSARLQLIQQYRAGQFPVFI
jgi:hypothetical protein